MADKVGKVDRAVARDFSDPAALHVPVTRATSSAIRSAAKRY